MALEPGRSLAHYRLAERIGEGGMGEVWRATDTTLAREVALKFLPTTLAADPERLARFEREAKVLASLNHPGIAGIYGLHEHQGIRFLAMELVPGEDLAQRLERGRIPATEAIDVARQIAEALEVAHDQGIVHRDLKPANVKLTPDGKVKVLDFGLAKALDPIASGGSSGMDSRMSPTITSLGTVAGVILGTAAYMSPEQAKGKAVDRRTDIWAFGCLLYEMLAGKRPFDGEGISEVLAAVIMAPIAFDALPPSIPSRLQQLVRRCLERDPRRRLRDIGEARLALEEIQAGTTEDTGAAPASASTKRSPAWIAMAATAVVAALATLGVHRALAPSAVPAPRSPVRDPGQRPVPLGQSEPPHRHLPRRQGDRLRQRRQAARAAAGAARADRHSDARDADGPVLVPRFHPPRLRGGREALEGACGRRREQRDRRHPHAAHRRKQCLLVSGRQDRIHERRGRREAGLRLRRGFRRDHPL